MKLNKYDKTFTKFIKLRAKYKCERCGRQYDSSSRGLHCSHYMGRTNQATRYDPDNAEALCYGCHSYFEDRKQTMYRDWKIERMGLEKVEEVERKSREAKKWKVGEKDEHRKWLQNKIKEYEQIQTP